MADLRLRYLLLGLRDENLELRIGKKKGKSKTPPAQDWGLYKSAQE